MLGQELPIRCWTSPCGASLKPTSRISNSLVNSAMVNQRRIKFGALTRLASMFKAAVGQSSSHSVGIMAFSAAFELSVPSARRFESVSSWLLVPRDMPMKLIVIHECGDAVSMPADVILNLPQGWSVTSSHSGYVDATAWRLFADQFVIRARHRALSSLRTNSGRKPTQGSSEARKTGGD